MMAGLSPSARRFLALALLLVPFALSVLLVIVPLRMAERHSRALADLEAHIAGLEERLVAREQVLADLRQLERRNQLDTRLLDAETPALAGAALAGSLAAFLEEAGGWLDSTQVLEPEPAEPLMRIGVRLRGAFDLSGLRSFLHRIEGAEPLLTIEELSLSSEQNSDLIGLLLTEIYVVGYARAPAGGSADQATDTADAS
jgi:hypothetical protein